MTEADLAGKSSVEVAELVEQKKVDAAVAGAFLLARFTRRLAKSREKVEA
jgi:hypothetical protein